ncbi:secondary thiamine-phosphate synthase enzyme YjbQ [Mangrovivirga sp. M17]|uniref:Secondary thiamine-phosphate synthase enzyme YjbQ n=1 Tax=Mangrovivirga halotolerans TaxID=2993936 RepID=A0ABT3RSQ0_9BACT|nr:secondary thiamine-phosphate synthase enzyme YjbQ [Mangrovivirga halotolerans]MCX2744815.1 secondary thiamine-phosphate synthase enzyme YjbQ [Mangrovivirga halotolerans]
MGVYQQEIAIEPKSRGFHVLTKEINKVLTDCPFDIGICTIFIKHTSASLLINESADPDVRVDFESYINRAVPENEPYFIHNYEGPDDMPAHIKAGLFGSSVNVPFTNRKLNLGTWQGVYLAEHRNHGGSRKLVITVIGE